MDVGDQGGATLVWHAPGRKKAIEATVLIPSANRFGRPQLLSKRLAVEVPTVAMTGDGKAIAVWEVFFRGTSLLDSSVYSPGTGWSAKESIQADIGPVVARVAAAIQGDGTGFAAWREFGNKGLLGGGLFVAQRSP